MRIAVLGGGYAGVTLVRRLERRLPDDVELVVVDDTGDHLVQHELHRLIRRPGFADDIVIPLDELVSRTEIREETVGDVDTDENEVTFSGGRSMHYDVAAVCLGAQTEYYGIDGVAEHSTPLKRVSHAREIRAKYLDVLADGGTVVVGGAGLSGVQVAGELAAMGDAASTDPHVVLLEMEAEVAPRFPDHFRRAVRGELEKQGVDVRTNTTLVQATEERLELELAGELTYDQFVWTGGIRGPDALDGSRPRVRANLQLDGDTFVVGDAGDVLDAEGERVPASAQAAVREAEVAARNIARIVEHRDASEGAFRPRLAPFTFDPVGWIVSVGDSAVAQVGPQTVTGKRALALKAAVGAMHLTSVGAVREAVDLVNEELGITRFADEVSVDVDAVEE